jgi:hypothetical protein
LILLESLQDFRRQRELIFPLIGATIEDGFEPSDQWLLGYAELMQGVRSQHFSLLLFQVVLDVARETMGDVWIAFAHHGLKRL